MGEIRGTFDQYFKCLQCEGVAETFTILRSCFNEAAVETLLITSLNCQRFTLKQQPAQEAQRRDERSSLLLCVFDGCRLVAWHPCHLKRTPTCGGVWPFTPALVFGGIVEFSGSEIRLKAPCVILKGAPVA